MIYLKWDKNVIELIIKIGKSIMNTIGCYASSTASQKTAGKYVTMKCTKKAIFKIVYVKVNGVDADTSKFPELGSGTIERECFWQNIKATAGNPNGKVIYHFITLCHFPSHFLFGCFDSLSYCLIQYGAFERGEGVSHGVT